MAVASAAAAATAGIPTLIEKPLAADIAVAHRLAHAFHATGVPAAVGYTERFNPALICLRARIQDGQLGDILEGSGNPILKDSRNRAECSIDLSALPEGIVCRGAV